MHSPSGYRGHSTVAAIMAALLLSLLPSAAFAGPPRNMNDLQTDFWSGYLAIGGPTYTKATAHWYVPCVSWTQGLNDPDNAQQVSVWVGLGGYGTPRLLQAGTTSKTIRSGTTFLYDYYAWFENTAAFNPTERRVFSVRCGQFIKASVDSTGALFISENGTDKVAQATILPIPDTHTADVIAEKPTAAGGRKLNLPVFTVDFTAAYLLDQQGQKVDLKSVPHERMNMINAANVAEVFVSDLSAVAWDEFTVVRNECVVICW